MPKRKRLFTPAKKNKIKTKVKEEIDAPKEPNILEDEEVSAARGRLKGVLMEVLEPAEESDTSVEQTPVKKERHTNKSNEENSEDEETFRPRRKDSPQRQSFVLKLFDRSVDLSQFEENSPLYPICRAWMINQPKENYKNYSSDPFVKPLAEESEDTVELPGPEGPPISRIPELLPEQQARSKDNINLDYCEEPPGREELLRGLAARWAAVRRAWLERAQLVEARYDAAQRVLNKINVNAL